MAAVKEHYEIILNDNYDWMFGGVDQNLEKNRKLFEELKIIPRMSKKAIDLGAGTGYQSIPLAKLGFNVLAIDSSEKLISNLNSNKGNLSIQAIIDDIKYVKSYALTKVELIVCMGDTLTHLQSLDEVRSLLDDCYYLMENGGNLILTFRDYCTELSELDRLIRVKTEKDKIFECFLTYENEKVTVMDVFHYLTEDGWQVKKSFYKKLKISSDWIRAILVKAGFKVELYKTVNGLFTIMAKK